MASDTQTLSTIHSPLLFFNAELFLLISSHLKLQMEQIEQVTKVDNVEKSYGLFMRHVFFCCTRIICLVLVKKVWKAAQIRVDSHGKQDLNFVSFSMDTLKITFITQTTRTRNISILIINEFIQSDKIKVLHCVYVCVCVCVSLSMSHSGIECTCDIFRQINMNIYFAQVCLHLTSSWLVRLQTTFPHFSHLKLYWKSFNHFIYSFSMMQFTYPCTIQMRHAQQQNETIEKQMQDCSSSKSSWNQRQRRHLHVPKCISDKQHPKHIAKYSKMFAKRKFIN